MFSAGSRSTVARAAALSLVATACLTPPGVASDATEGDGVRRRLTLETADLPRLGQVPVLVVLNADRIDFGKTRADGSDLHFRAADGSLLPHEVEVWEPDAVSLVWVAVPELGDDAPDHIWMHYGGDTPVDEPTPPLWSAYNAVYHLLPSGLAGDADATGAHPGSANGGETVVGAIGPGRGFDGVDDRIVVDGPLLLADVASFTIEAWVRPDELQDDGVVFGASVQDDVWSRGELKVLPDLVVNLTVRTTDDPADQAQFNNLQSAAGSLNSNEWAWLVGVVDFPRDRMTIYVDGQMRMSQGGLLGNGRTPATPSYRVTIGADEGFSFDWMAGALDEVRIARTAHSTPWIAVQYASMSDQLIAFGPEEP